jgi:CheY-like chemotaxis protein
MKVLIADDDRLVREMLADVLSELGHTVVAAANGNEAVELWRRERPDAVILDFLMPKLSGLDALEAMRSGGRHVPAVLLTAISDRSVRALKGADAPGAFLEKPFSKKSVEKALARALRSE